MGGNVSVWAVLGVSTTHLCPEREFKHDVGACSGIVSQFVISMYAFGHELLFQP